MSMLHSNGMLLTAGSRFIRYGGVRSVCMYEFILCMNVVLPEPAGCQRRKRNRALTLGNLPAMPIQTTTVGFVAILNLVFGWVV
jgi:hypothetical protein